MFTRIWAKFVRDRVYEVTNSWNKTVCTIVRCCRLTVKSLHSRPLSIILMHLFTLLDWRGEIYGAAGKESRVIIRIFPQNLHHLITRVMMTPYIRAWNRSERHCKPSTYFSFYLLFFFSDGQTAFLRTGSDRIDIVIGKLTGAILSALPAGTAFMQVNGTQADCPYDPVRINRTPPRLYTVHGHARARVFTHIIALPFGQAVCRCTVKPRSRNRNGPVRPKRYNGNTSPGCILPFVH